MSERTDQASAAERRRLSRLYRMERDLTGHGFAAIAGIDEVGRGALAGPVTAAAVVLPAKPRIRGLNDSKALTPLQRRRLSEEIRALSICWSVGHASAAEIDAVGMGRALRIAMTRALDMLDMTPDIVLVDGNPIGVAPGEIAVVGGDGKVAAIAAASIVAKVARDELMTRFAEVHPGYGFAQHKGYTTRGHLCALDVRGLCALHRRSFAPCDRPPTLF
jgi:ribonuclease HII